jgi:hypothetical protein
MMEVSRKIRAKIREISNQPYLKWSIVLIVWMESIQLKDPGPSESWGG